MECLKSNKQYTTWGRNNLSKLSRSSCVVSEFANVLEILCMTNLIVRVYSQVSGGGIAVLFFKSDCCIHITFSSFLISILNKGLWKIIYHVFFQCTRSQPLADLDALYCNHLEALPLNIMVWFKVCTKPI